MGIDAYNLEVKTITAELEAIVSNYDGLIKNARSKDVSQMLIQRRDEVIMRFDEKLRDVQAVFFGDIEPEQEDA